MIEWLSMGGYAYYVWMSYGMLAIAIVLELFSLAARRRHALDQVAQYDEEAGFEEKAG
ncbi:MAG: heme exporter protein CcmD [Burkholderiaceae bacterium]|jgi:heme exporter protein D|nr:heme exporter protein CcmD [Burkholderiaceae bacterium]MEB2320821.1 heme exporter protein CcmD [Pseudomonadota bacterium]